MVLPQVMALVQYWFRVLSLKFCGKSKKICGDISQLSPAFCMYGPVYTWGKIRNYLWMRRFAYMQVLHTSSLHGLRKAPAALLFHINLKFYVYTWTYRFVRFNIVPDNWDCPIWSQQKILDPWRQFKIQLHQWKYKHFLFIIYSKLVTAQSALYFTNGSDYQRRSDVV